MKCAIYIAAQKGAPSWLSSLLVAVHGFDLRKRSFQDAICLRYGWTMPNLPFACVCEANFSLNNALQCHIRDFPILRHNEVQDLLANLLKEVCDDVKLEPSL